MAASVHKEKSLQKKENTKRNYMRTPTSNIAMMSDNSNKIIRCTFLIWIQPVEI